MKHDTDGIKVWVVQRAAHAGRLNLDEEEMLSSFLSFLLSFLAAMCGFAGIVAWEDRFRFGRETLEKMSARIAHRGPDGEGTYLNHESALTPANPQCGLVHRRLAVIDLDPRSLQPFDDARKRRWLVYNGEIYNFRELRADLSRLRPDYVWRTHCDTEVLLVAYEVWGQQCADHFNGMFAFAVWDETTSELFLARDRMGQKPLYYALKMAGSAVSAVAFASELSALRQVRWVTDTIDLAGVGEYLRWGYIPVPQTIYCDASKLAPAMWMRIARRGIEAGHYFDPNEPAVSPRDPRESLADATRRLVTSAVKRRLVADVPLGCFLSGGIDSSVIAAAMKASADPGQPVLTFSIGFDDPRYDETRYAAAVARHLGTTHQQFIVRPDAAADLPKLAAVFGEPFGDSSALPTHYLARETRQHVTVALSGDGGDEMFGGYDRYRAMALAERIGQWPKPFGWVLGSPFWQLLPGTHPKARLSRLKRFLSTLNLSSRRRYAGYMALFCERGLRDLMGPDVGARVGKGTWLLDIFDKLRRPEVVPTALAVDRVTYLPEDLLTKVDRCSMLHALEVRSPFMDYELVHFAAGLKTEDLLVGGGKRLLREAFAADLPPEVFQRRKMGFAVPVGEWFRGPLKDLLHDQIFAKTSFASTYLNPAVIQRLIGEHQRGGADHSQRLYALLMLELWWHQR